MRHYFTILLLLMATCTHAQVSFKPMRYDEDYHKLSEDSTLNAYQSIKYIPVGHTDRYYLSFGGEVRFQYFKFKQEDWGDAPEDKSGYILSRYLAHADFHAGKNFRVFIQLQSSLAASKLTTSPVDENVLDLHQFFAEYRVGNLPGLSIRIGRQELAYGSQRLISVRELPNNRQSFDAVKLMYQKGNLQLDAFYSQYVYGQKDIFDDALTGRAKLWSLYATVKNLPYHHHADIYYMGYHKKNAVFDDGTGQEIRHSLGSRLWATKGPFNYDLEGVYQFGQFSEKTIRAWTVSANLEYKLAALPLQPKFGLKTELISGDKRYDDDRLQTFNPLYPKGAYFGLAALIGPSNLIDLHPSVELSINPRLNFSADYDLFWRMSRHDGIYGPNVALLYTGKNSNDRFIGSQFGANFTYQPNPYLYFRLEGTWFQAADYLEAVSTGKDILFTALTATFKF